MKAVKGFLDRNLNKIMSRKFQVWVTASVFLALGMLDADNWTAIAVGYVGLEGFGDLAQRWKHGTQA